ncbi:plasma kallikrein [Microcaecilia unicolor]|uniref:Plasma kallikrein n=1 Tax=Microcaecilia unicolor TaxID=1415580 RepID=A0A6P7WXV3_9AMPH|nr:plasma kallikrein [Microcaecilia unicolor]
MLWIYPGFCLIFLSASVHSECSSEFYNDTFFQGGDISAVFAPDAKYCQTVCTYDPHCLFFTFLPEDWKNETERFACFLKDSEKGMLQNVTLKGAVSGYSLKQCNTNENACNFDTYTGLDMIGTNYNVTTEDNVEKCQDRCTNDIFCQFFTYATDTFHSITIRNKCYLKYSMKGTPSRIMLLDNVISGFSLQVCGLSNIGCMSDIFPEFELSGDNITSVFAPDVFTCQKICTFYPNCLFFTFFSKQWSLPSQRHLCILKTSKAGKPTDVQQKQNTFSGFSLLSCRKRHSACHSAIFSDVDFLGDELVVAYVNGEKECQQLCTKTIHCQFFTYNSAQEECRQTQCKCYLRLSSNGFPTGIQHRLGGVSGFSKRICKIKTNDGTSIVLPVLAMFTTGPTQHNTTGRKKSLWSRMVSINRHCTRIFRMVWIYQGFCLIFLFVSVYSECRLEFYNDTFFQGGDISAVFAPNAKYCQTVCTYDPRCLFFTFLPEDWKKESERFACFLKDSEKGMLRNVTLKGAISGYSLKQCTTTDNACTFDIYKGLDMIGTNYNVTTEINVEKCQDRCTNDIFCQFFTYATDTFHSEALRNKCYLKYSIKGTPTRIRLLDNVVSGFSLQACGLSKLDCMTDTSQNQEFWGDNITNVFAPDANVCQKICTFYPNCLFYTFYSEKWNVPSQRYSCFLKTSRTGTPTAPQAKENALSGFSQLRCRKEKSACHRLNFLNVDFLGDELAVANVNGANECQQLCTNTIRCQFFTYNSTQEECRQKQCKCYLRMTSNGFPTGIQHRLGSISGFSRRICKITTNDVCGKSEKLEFLRVVGGKNSSINNWPWQLSLHIKGFSSSRHICGGSIINNQWILTAAHCIPEQLKRNDIWIIYGGISSQSEINKTTPFFTVKEIIIHPLYDQAEKGYDIALFKLGTPMPYTLYQKPICLPSKEFRNNVFSSCWITGWGYTLEKGKAENVLQEATIPLISNEDCQSNYKNYKITNLMVCAGYEQGAIDACKGDSGGPLVCKHEENWYLIGVTSWGEGCGRPGQPGVYTKVSNFIDWILETTKQ